MTIALLSIFRNSAGRHISLYFQRVRALRAALPAETLLRLVLVEGDSTDRTTAQLCEEAAAAGLPLDLVTRNHGGPVYGSTEEPTRLQALSYVVNGGLDAVRETDDVVVYVESDLIWEPATILRLISQLAPGKDVLAPLIFAGTAFYDIWAFRKSGIRFGPFEPFHHELVVGDLTEVDSVGSCLVMRAEVARNVRMSDYALVQFCDRAREQGYHIWADARERIHHP